MVNSDIRLTVRIDFGTWTIFVLLKLIMLVMQVTLRNAIDLRFREHELWSQADLGSNVSPHLTGRG